MKVCPICQSSYEDGVDFCFKDGAPLEGQGGDELSPADETPSLSGLTQEDLEPPDAVSMSGLIPIVTDEDDLATLSLAADLPPLEEDELATVTSGIQPLARSSESLDPDSVSDPFEDSGAARFRERMTLETPAWAETTEESGAGAGDTDDRMDTVQWEGRPVRVDGSSGSDKRVFGFVGLLCLLVAGLIGYQIVVGGAQDTDGDAASSSSGETLAEGPAESAAGASVAESPEADSEAAAPDAVPEDLPEEGTPEDGLSDAGEAEEPVDEEAVAAESDEQPVNESTEGPPAVDPPAADPPAAEADEPPASEEEERLRREERKKQREEERKKAREERKKAREEQARRDALASAAQPETPAVAKESAAEASDSPWVVARPPEDVTPAAKLEVAADNPWGAPAATPATPSSGVLTISSTPKGARVKVGGRARGTTPVKLDLPVGTHEVRVEKPDHATQTRYVKVTGTEPVRLVVTLESLAAPAAKRQGSLFVSSTPPGAALYVDGVSRGRTPLTVTVDEGTHSVRLVYEGKDPLVKRIKVDFSNTSTVRRFFEIP